MGTRYQSVTCEPFRAWNRLEPRPRKKEFDQAIKAEVHDPLWMLSRQWQFGEFKGEDTGSAIFAKIQIEHTRIKKFQPGNKDAEIAAFNPEVPLEKIVESMPFEPGFKGRVQSGDYFLKLLHKTLDGKPHYQQHEYRNRLLELYPVQKVEIEESDSPEVKVQKANLLANLRLQQFMAVFTGKSVDGLKLYDNLKNNINGTLIAISRHPDHNSHLAAIITKYISWFEKSFDRTPKDQHSSWINQKLEYHFACSLPEKSGTASLLVADEFASGSLDWYSFDIEKKSSRFAELFSGTLNEGEVKTETFSFIPTEARFAGMPNNRWWEFEDGKVDLGNISAETTDIAKSVTAEYALIYGNDWFVVPYTLPVGSLSKVNGLMVTDVFGQKTFVEAAAQGQTDDWTSWGLFNLSVKKQTATQQEACDTRLFLPPALPKIHESESIEEVLMLRDEMANMVWGIETIVNDLLSRGIDGHTLGNEKKRMLHGEEEPPLEAVPEALLKYILANEVPENWIPFIPSHNDSNNRSMQLQRASMPRKLDGKYLAIRPRTELLRFGFENKPVNELEAYLFIDANKQLQPSFLNEEEVPRSGAKIYGKLQRSRWFNGEIINWYGYAKELGRGEGSSGLLFDQMKLLKKNKENVI